MIEISYNITSVLSTACVFWVVHNLGIKTLDLVLFVLETAVEAFANKVIKIKRIIPVMIYCGKCSSFWFLIIFNQNIYDAAIIAVSVWFIDLTSTYLISNSKIKL